MPNIFEILPDPSPCPVRTNCYCYSESATGNCTLDYERERGANACDFVQWINPPISTFNTVDIVATSFKINPNNLEPIEGEQP